MRNVYLYGHLKKVFGAQFRLNADTPGQVIRLLAANFPAFTEELKKGHYRLIRGPRRTGASLPIEAIELGLGRADFHLVPVVGGAKNGGVLKTILGTALVGAAIFFSGGTLAAPLAGMSTTLFGGLTWGNVAVFGLITALAGVSQLITPTEKKEESKNQKENSFAFSGPINMNEQGYPVPLIYGEVITGGIPASATFDVADIPLG